MPKYILYILYHQFPVIDEGAFFALGGTAAWKRLLFLVQKLVPDLSFAKSLFQTGHVLDMNFTLGFKRFQVLPRMPVRNIYTIPITNIKCVFLLAF
jgi:hypothetical protein